MFSGKRSNGASHINASLPRNEWYIHKLEGPEPDHPQSVKELLGDQSKSADHIITWNTLIICVFVIDLIWFLHRMTRTGATAKMLLYGCPLLIDCRKQKSKCILVNVPYFSEKAHTCIASQEKFTRRGIGNSLISRTPRAVLITALKNNSTMNNTEAQIVSYGILYLHPSSHH